jgi:isopentenyldiphosphate isomerase
MKERRKATEQFDVLDRTGARTGTRIGRDDAHASGTWHGAFHCLMIYRRRGRGYALFQKRSDKKKIAPGKFDVSVGGHYSAGEDARSAGPREIREELGLTIAFQDLAPLGRRVFVYSFAPGISENEFQDIFLLLRNIDPGELTLQKDELDGIVEMEVGKGIDLFSGKIRALQLSLMRPSRSWDTITVTADDFVPNLDNYYLKLLMLAQRYMNGERDLLLI